jgi:DNA replication and repair protein RecF
VTSAVGRITRLTLASYRNYDALDLTVASDMVALAGDNGAGKTNILEAISLFTPGRGLRRADFADMAKHGATGGFAASIRLQGQHGETQLGAGHHPESGGRLCRIDREPVASAAAFAEHCRVIWLTPDNDGLFRGPAGDRRRFLDRLVLAVDSSHGARVNSLEKSLRARNRLLEESQPNAAWLDAVEREAAETAVAVAAARRETITRLAGIALEDADSGSPFPHALLSIEGDLEIALAEMSALDVEERHRMALREGRWRDKAAGRALSGPNASDLVVSHGPKDMPAALCSTGEQKALLLGLILAHARLVRQMSGIAPILLLDEVAAHLDAGRRSALYGRLATLGGQVWMTGTDAGLFQGMPGSSELFSVAAGAAAPFLTHASAPRSGLTSSTVGS